MATLQTTIQQIKLLIDNENPKFAPIKFVYIMDILETFKLFVFNRMKKLAFPNLSDDKIERLNCTDSDSQRPLLANARHSPYFSPPARSGQPS